jgi:hypothetical protein
MSDTLQPGDTILDPTIGLVEDKDGNITSRMERPLDPPLPHGYVEGYSDDVRP